LRASPTRAGPMMAFARGPPSVPALTASRSISPVEIFGIPLACASRSACVPFPAPGGPSITRFNDIVESSADLQVRCRADLQVGTTTCLRSSPTNPRLLHEPVVVPHDQLALDLLHRVHRDADDNQERRATEVKQHAH